MKRKLLKIFLFICTTSVVFSQSISTKIQGEWRLEYYSNNNYIQFGGQVGIAFESSGKCKIIDYKQEDSKKTISTWKIVENTLYIDGSEYGDIVTVSDQILIIKKLSVLYIYNRFENQVATFIKILDELVSVDVFKGKWSTYGLILSIDDANNYIIELDDLTIPREERIVEQGQVQYYKDKLRFIIINKEDYESGFGFIDILMLSKDSFIMYGKDDIQNPSLCLLFNRIK